MFEMATPAWDIALRSLLVYVAVFVGLRLMGKREMGQMTVFDLVVVLLIANAVQNAMVGRDTSLQGGILAALVLLVVNRGIGLLRLRGTRWGRLLEGTPTVLVEEGQFHRASPAQGGAGQGGGGDGDPRAWTGLSNWRQASRARDRRIDQYRARDVPCCAFSQARPPAQKRLNSDPGRAGRHSSSVRSDCLLQERSDLFNDARISDDLVVPQSGSHDESGPRPCRHKCFRVCDINLVVVAIVHHQRGDVEVDGELLET